MYKLNFFPMQPDLFRNTNTYEEWKPLNGHFAKQVAIFYEFTTKDVATFPITIIPDGCFDLLFLLSDKEETAYLWTTPFARKKQNFLKKNAHYLGVRFWPEQTMLTFKDPMKLFMEQVIPLQETLHFDKQIFQDLYEAPSFRTRIQVLQQFLLTFQQEPLLEMKIIQSTIQQIYIFNGQCSLKMVANSTGYTEQYIRRLFERFIGLSPKQFAQVVQFQQTINLLNTDDQIDFQDLIHKGGYYDQAHFIKQFKKHMCTTPKMYLKQLS